MEDRGVPHKKNSFPSTILTQWISCTQCHKIFQKVKWFFPVQAVATIVSRDLDLRIEKNRAFVQFTVIRPSITGLIETIRYILGFMHAVDNK